MVKNISNYFLRNIRNEVSILAVLQAGNFLYPATAWIQICS